MSETDSSQPVKLTHYFNADDVLIDAKGLSRDDLIRQLLSGLDARHEIGDIESIYQAVLARESLSATTVAPGIAFPHARITGLKRLYVAIATSREGVQFSVDSPPVHLAVLFLIPTRMPALYLQILRSLAKILADPHAAEKVSSFATPGEVVHFFDRGGQVFPPHLCAVDVMEAGPKPLSRHEPLKNAIDRFIQEGVRELPVTDADGDIVGVVSARALLKVCLPDYLLWMGDLSPIVNFEPFTEVLRGEASASIEDIITDEFPALQLGDPAISAVGAFTRRGASVCYVLDGHRLKGVVTLNSFLNKIFRE
jgi:mannitol/fructose-specific phosphotransferase system IIA component (Ntr-type)